MSQHYLNTILIKGKKYLFFMGMAIVAGGLLQACDSATENTPPPPVDSVAVTGGSASGGTVVPDSVVKAIADTIAAPADNVQVAPEVSAPDTAKKKVIQKTTAKTDSIPKTAVTQKKKPKTEVVEKDVVEMPDQSALPEGGYPAFYKYIRANLQYPMEAKQKGVEGKVSVQFIVNTDGSLSNVKVSSGIGAGCDEEALRVVKEAPKWQPAMHKGVPVRHRTTIYIVFKLN